MSKKVLFITCDQLRHDVLGYANGWRGQKLVETPNIDALANDGVIFDKAFTVTAPCGPARSSLLTGLYAMNHRAVVNGAPLSADIPNIAREVRKAGVEPVLFGYTDSTVDPRTVDPNDPATRTYEGVLPGMRLAGSLNMEHLHDWLSQLAKKGYQIPERHLDIYHHVDAQGRLTRDSDLGEFQNGPALYRAEDSDTAFIADAAMDYMRVRANEDWFMHLVFFKPHPPLIAPAGFHDRANWQDVPLPPRAQTPSADAGIHPLVGWWHSAIEDPAYFGCQRSMLELSDDEVRKAIAVYLGLIAEVDHQMGRLIKLLKDTGQYDDTLIIFTSDHGEELGSHHIWGKGGFFDGSYRVPLIIRDPKGRAGARVSELVESVDLVPTILDWLGRPPLPYQDGYSLLPWLQTLEGAEQWREAVMLEFDWRQPGNPEYHSTMGLSTNETNLAIWRTQTEKLVYFANGDALHFDLESDPDEMNLSPSTRDSVGPLTSQLLSHRMKKQNQALPNWFIR